MIYVLTITLLALAILTIVTLIKIQGSSPIFWILVPLLIFNIGFTWIVMYDLKGWPVDAMPPNDSTFYNSIMSKPDIYVVAKPKDANEPRFYVIPFTEENAEQVKNAGQMKERGQIVIIKQERDNFKAEVFDHTTENKKELTN